MTKLLDTIEEIKKGTIAKYKLYILVDEYKKLIKLVNITDIKIINGTEGNFVYTTLKIKEYKTNDELEDIIISTKFIQYSIPYTNNNTLSLGSGKYLMKYNNIYEAKKLIKGITVYGLGYHTNKPILIDKPMNTFSAKKYKTLIKELKQMYKELKYEII